VEIYPCAFYYFLTLLVAVIFPPSGLESLGNIGGNMTALKSFDKFTANIQQGEAHTHNLLNVGLTL